MIEKKKKSLFKITHTRNRFHQNEQKYKNFCIFLYTK